MNSSQQQCFNAYREQEIEFSQAPFWFWNDDLDVNEITRQMADFKRHGVHAVVIHPRAGLPRSLGWMSNALLGFMRHAIDQAVEQGMWVMLYDEAMYPSGSGGGLVVADDPAHACRGLVQVDLTSSRPGDTVQGVRVEPNGVELDNRQTLVAVVTRQHDGHELAIVDTPIHSTIRGIHFVEEDPPRRADHREVAEENPPAADLLNPLATASFIRSVYQRFHDAFAPHFGTTIRAIFTDEPDLLGKGRPSGLDPRPGTTGILEHVNDRLGYDFTPHLPALWDENEPDATRHRRAYNRAIQFRLQETYYKPLSEWCAAHGVALTGHPAASMDIGLLRHFQIPGQDVVWRMIEHDSDTALIGPDSTMAKAAASAMLHRGRRRNLNEFAGAYGPELTFREYRWLALWLLIRGCNMLVPHAFYYSTRGPRIDERPPDVGPNSPWWDRYKAFADMTGKICWLNTDSTQRCRVAILCEDDALPWDAARVCLENQIDFNYLERSLLAEADISDAGISLAGMTYTVLVLETDGYDTGDDVLPEALVKAGRTIRWAAQEGAGALLQKLERNVSRTLTAEPTYRGLRVRHVSKEGVEYIIVFNEGESDFLGRLQVPGARDGTRVEMDSGMESAWSPGDELTLATHACMVLTWHDQP